MPLRTASELLLTIERPDGRRSSGLDGGRAANLGGRGDVMATASVAGVDGCVSAWRHASEQYGLRWSR